MALTIALFFIVEATMISCNVQTGRIFQKIFENNRENKSRKLQNFKAKGKTKENRYFLPLPQLVRIQINQIFFSAIIGKISFI